MSRFYGHATYSPENTVLMLSRQNRGKTWQLAKIMAVYEKCSFFDFCIARTTLCFKKNAPTLEDYNYDPVQSI